MEKIKVFFVVLFLVSARSFVSAFLLGLLVNVFYPTYTVDIAVYCGIGTAIGCGPVNAIFAAVNA